MEHLVLPGEVIRVRLENCDCEDYQEMILAYLADKLGYDYDEFSDEINVKLRPADNQKLIEFSGNESTLYDLMTDLSQYGYEPITKYPILTYDYDLLHRVEKPKNDNEYSNLGSSLF